MSDHFTTLRSKGLRRLKNFVIAVRTYPHKLVVAGILPVPLVAVQWVQVSVVPVVHGLHLKEGEN